MYGTIHVYMLYTEASGFNESVFNELPGLTNDFSGEKKCLLHKKSGYNEFPDLTKN